MGVYQAISPPPLKKGPEDEATSWYTLRYHWYMLGNLSAALLTSMVVSAFCLHGIAAV